MNQYKTKLPKFLFEIDNHGAYRYGTLCLIPYRHHKNSLLWLILILNECKPEIFNAISENVTEAVESALESYKQKVEMLGQMEKEKSEFLEKEES